MAGQAAKRWASQYPHLGTGPVSSGPSVDPEFFAKEREAIFKRSWLNVGTEQEVPNIGDYVVRDIEVAAVSILIIRGKDRKVRAFHNVCSHRGNKLVWDRSGNSAGNFVCNLHCWGYDTLGKLKFVPDEENFHDLDKAQLGLVPIRLESFRGFLFINLDSESPESLLTYLAGVAPALAEADFAQFACTRSYTITENANWKILIDAQNEIYHIPFQHRHILKGITQSNEKGAARLSDISLMGRHSRYSANMNADFRPPPFEMHMAQLMANSAERRLPLVSDMIDFYLLYPNFVIIIQRGVRQDMFVTYNIWPSAVDKTRWEIRLYTMPATTALERITNTFMHTRTRLVFDEDAASHEAVHEGIKSRARPELFFQDEEIQLRHFHHVVENQVAAWAAERGADAS